MVEDFLSQTFSNKLELRFYLEKNNIPSNYEVVNKFWELLNEK